MIATPPAVKTGYCWFCSQPKYPGELVTVLTKRGAKRVMCRECKKRRGKNS